eukprot:scaffold175508_cov22-Tisochrysis_lutea.AAC.2
MDVVQVGVFATRGGELSVVEYSELTPEQVRTRGLDSLMSRYGRSLNGVEDHPMVASALVHKKWATNVGWKCAGHKTEAVFSSKCCNRIQTPVETKGSAFAVPYQRLWLTVLSMLFS